ncbi:MAG: hypothetical protein DSM106950_39715 [Stigonema ocellatum SAG 48.90 = DSM 106950]|nr:hypothetical protein [Stigonema ocellatum SAG 48.90 = DSM 106950]
MTTNKLPKNKDKKVLIPKHPLAKLAGKFSGELWEDTLDEIQRFRETDKEEMKKHLDSSLTHE